MTARAVLRRVAADGSYELEIDEAQTCSGCRGVCMWRLLPRTQLRLGVDGDESLAADLPVIVSLPQRYVLLASLMLYGMPLGALLVGATLVSAFGGGDLACLFGAGGALALAIAMTPRLRRRLEQRTAEQLAVQRTA